MIKTPLTRWFDLTTPVIGAPMAGVAGGAMARAVSDGGGLGMIGISGSHTADFVTEQCAIPADAQVPFGVGLMIWVLETRPDLFEATVAAQPSLVSVSFGDPAPYVGPLHDAGIAVCAQVNTTADVHRALDAGVDVLVAQGTRGRRAHRPARHPAAAAGGAHADRPARGGGRRHRDRPRDGGRPRRGRGRRCGSGRRCCRAPRGSTPPPCASGSARRAATRPC